MRRLLVVLALLGGCANAHVNRATLIASTAALVADWQRTRTFADHQWTCGATGYRERNPILGDSPQTGAVDAYFTITAMANLAIWLVVPQRYKSAVPVGIMALESRPLIFNADMASGAEVCGR